MRTSALFEAKNFGFFEIYGVSARTRGEEVEPVRTFFGQEGRVSIFRDFVRTSFMDGPLALLFSFASVNSQNYGLCYSFVWAILFLFYY